jgi:hypothetical protein
VLTGKRVTFTRLKGRAVEAKSAFSFIGNIQPMSGVEAKALPVETNNQGLAKVYTNERLNVAEEGNSNSGDTIEAWGKEWQVIYEMPNQNELINHYKYVAQLLGDAS